MIEEIEVQTTDEVKRIDYMKATNETLNSTIDEQTAHLENISASLDDINNAINAPTDLTDVINSIDNIDTTVVENQTQNILQTVSNQQQQIDNIQSDVQEIKELLTQLINK